MPLSTRRCARALLVALALALLPLSGFAQEPVRWYKVELIVFARTQQEYLKTEVWPQVSPLTDAKGAVKLQPRSTKALQPFQLLTAGEMQLDGIYTRLKASKKFEPLLHVGWRQPGMALNKATPVFLSMPDIPLPGSAGTTAAVPGASAEPPRLEGTVTFKVGRYLHLDSHLIYWARMPAEPAPAAPVQLSDTAATTEGVATLPVSSVEPANHWQGFVLDESRRLRIGELHYFDHPMFGMIAIVTPN